MAGGDNCSASNNSTTPTSKPLSPKGRISTPCFADYIPRRLLHSTTCDIPGISACNTVLAWLRSPPFLLQPCVSFACIDCITRTAPEFLHFSHPHTSTHTSRSATMPRAADLEEALKKKGGLTLSQLANYDDLITDALVDRVREPDSLENARMCMF